MSAYEQGDRTGAARPSSTAYVEFSVQRQHEDGSWYEVGPIHMSRESAREELTHYRTFIPDDCALRIVKREISEWRVTDQTWTRENPPTKGSSPASDGTSGTDAKR